MDNRGKLPRRQPQCKACFKLYRDAHKAEISANKSSYYRVRADERKAYVGEWQKRNKERRKVVRAKWLAANADEMKAIRRAWLLANPERVLAARRRRQLARSGAVPKWASREEMRRFYADARKLTKETGILHTVDHIVPIVSDLVCGLHCEANLQVMPHAANAAKGNRWWPDMP
jgi:hypothetical protein